MHTYCQTERAVACALPDAMLRTTTQEASALRCAKTAAIGRCQSTSQLHCVRCAWPSESRRPTFAPLPSLAALSASTVPLPQPPRHCGGRKLPLLGHVLGTSEGGGQVLATTICSVRPLWVLFIVTMTSMQ